MTEEAQSGATFGVCGIHVGASSLSFTLIWQLPVHQLAAQPNTSQPLLSQIGKKELAEIIMSRSSSFRAEYLGLDTFVVGHFSDKEYWSAGLSLKVPHLH